MESRASARALIDRMAEVARPGEGAAKILLLFARMAGTPCEWLEGDLSVEMAGDEQSTVVEIMLDHGGILERAFPLWTLNVGIAEIVRAVTLAPEMVSPLIATTIGANRLAFAATEAERKITTPRLEIPAEYGVLAPANEPKNEPARVAPARRRPRPIVASKRVDPRREPDDD